MTKKTKTIVTYKLPEKISISQSCFSKTFSVIIGGLRGKLIMPTIYWNKDKPTIVAPPMGQDLSKYVHHYVVSGEDEWQQINYWGKVNVHNPKEHVIKSASIRSVLIELELDSEKITYSNYLYGRGHPQGEDIKRLFDSIEEWFKLLMTWISVAGHQDPGFHGSLASTIMKGYGISVFTVDDTTISLPATSSHLIVNLTPFENVNLKTLKSIIVQTNKGISPPDSHLLLLDSWAAFRRDQFKRCVIEAGSALEIVLVELNHSLVRINTGSRSTPPPLGWYVNQPAIASAAGLPTNTQQDVVDVRNNAIHNNIVPTREQSKTALDLVQRLVDRLDALRYS